LLQSVGVPCGHEAVFNRRCCRKRAQRLAAESSAFALPYLEKGIADTAMVVHLVRNPWRVLRNWLIDGNSIFSIRKQPKLRPNDLWLLRHTRTLDSGGSPVLLALKFYVEWNKRVEALPNVVYRHAVEESPRMLLDSFGITASRERLFPNTHYNTRRKNRLSRFEIDGMLRVHGKEYEAFRELTDEYGYTLCRTR
jgi:hypothetical protein